MWQRIKNIYHLGQAIITNIIYGFPGRKAAVIGVTGTDGKTTTTALIYHILKTAGRKVSMITSVGAYIGDNVYDIGFHVTTPSPLGMQKYLRRAVDWGAEYIVLETTSHAIDQNRIWGIPYQVGVLTNITHEHLDYHKTREEYAGTKIKFIAGCRWSVVNMDDKSYEFFMRFGSQKKYTTYSLTNDKADITPKKFPFETKLLGDFNKSNCLAAVAACKSLGIRDADIRKGIVSFTAPPGRQETIYDEDFRVIIDFAHTPNAFAAVLPEVRKITTGRIIHVFGSAGKRDVSKRPEMGKEAAKYDDIIILTAEDPRNEAITDINQSILSGIDSVYTVIPYIKFQILNIKNTYKISNMRKTVLVIPDRKEAIKVAVRIAGKGDTVLLTGKAHEKSMNLGHGEEPWDEFGETKAALKAGNMI